MTWAPQKKCVWMEEYKPHLSCYSASPLNLEECHQVVSYPEKEFTVKIHAATTTTIIIRRWWWRQWRWLWQEDDKEEKVDGTENFRMQEYICQISAKIYSHQNWKNFTSHIVHSNKRHHRISMQFQTNK